MKTTGILLLSSSIALLLSLSSVLAFDPNTKDPRAIMEMVESRSMGDRVISMVKMIISDEAERKRERVVNSRAMEFPEGTKTIMFFESPADVRGTGMFSIDYKDGDKSDDQWLYLPSLHKSTRISGGDKSGSFMGSDLTYADMTKKNTNNYDYQLIKESEKVDGEDAWLIEARPRTQKEQEETGYVKNHAWISKEKLIPLQSKAWVKEGKKLKYTKFSDFKKIDTLWFSNKIDIKTMRNNKIESSSTMIFMKRLLNQPEVKSEDFSLQRLEQGL